MTPRHIINEASRITHAAYSAGHRQGLLDAAGRLRAELAATTLRRGELERLVILLESLAMMSAENE